MELGTTLARYHARNPEVNEEYDPEVGPREFDKYQDYTQKWYKCCGPAQILDDSAYLALVDAPGGFSRDATGILLFDIYFYSGEAGRRACKCVVGQISFRLYIGQNKAKEARPGDMDYSLEVAKCVTEGGGTK